MSGNRRSGLIVAEAEALKSTARLLGLRYIMRKTILAIVVCLQIMAVVYAAVASATSSPSTSAPAGQSADSFLHSVYDRYIGSQDQAPFIDYTKERELRRYFEPSLAKIIADDSARAAKKGDVGMLDGDPFIDAQDWNIRSSNIQVTPIDADHANAVVKFDNIGEAKLLRVQLVRISGVWKIHDIDYGGKEGTLRGLFKAGGSTSNTVTPLQSSIRRARC
jgi:hypothetical protein